MAEDKAKLLIVEDDSGLQKQLKWCFAEYEVIVAADRAAAIAALRRHEPAVVLRDLGLPPDAEGVSEGFACLLETLDPGEMPLDGVIAISDSMTKACRAIEKVAPTNASVLLLGESGTGKESLAKAVHALSPRAAKPFVAINCAAIPENLLESELFGHEKGAFTGAVRQTQGKFEQANGGTIFLDEIGDMPLALQAKLLRFLQDRVVERIGGRDCITVDVRIVCATSKDPLVLIQAGEFREDLYYRISEVTVRIPPLRDRVGDAIVIARAILDRRAAEHGRPVRGFTPEALKAIDAYPWPGNIGELENRVNGAVIMTEGKHVSEMDLGLPCDGGSDLRRVSS
ncbi:MAG: sigma 54-interacting transcriptional regulator [Gammaproteobacteria bacterium]|nr:sigma 54-interacting transcriptional regulator [Gammaproteobacteria bacterium]